MKFKQLLTSILGGLFLLTPAMPIATVYAVENQSTLTETQVQTDTNEDKPTEKEISERQERLNKRKADLKTSLSFFQKSNLKDKCKSAQGKISSVSGRVNGIETSREKVHVNIVNRLTELSVKLKNKNISTTEFDATIVELQAKITTFKTDLAIYKQALSDMSAMDCASDPEAFKATLDSARTSLETVKADAAAIRTYLKDTIKPLLVTIRTQISDSKPTEGN